MIGMILLIALVVVSACGVLWTLRSGARYARVDWETLVAKLELVPFEPLQRVAMEHLNPQGKQLELEPSEMWEMLGGYEGLRRMKRNAQILIALAAYVQRWNFTEAIVVAERMHQDALLLRRSLFRIQLGFWLSAARLKTPFHLHMAAASYYLMTQRVRALYEANQFVLAPQLSAAL